MQTSDKIVNRTESSLVSPDITLGSQGNMNSTEKRNFDSVKRMDYKFDDWEVGNRYIIKRVLGPGSYGEVVEAFDTM